MPTIETKFGSMQEVFIPDAGYQKARVIEISIKRFNISYCVEYFLNGESKSCWLYEDQIATELPKEGQAGFKP